MASPQDSTRLEDAWDEVIDWHDLQASPPRKPEFLTLYEASKRFGVSIYTLRSWRNRRWIIRYMRGDGLVVVDAGEIQKHLDSRLEIIKHSESDQADD